jgi:hypothetical protein
MAKPTTYGELVQGIIDIINILIPVLFGLVFVYFIWKMIDSWVINAGAENSQEEGKQYAIAAVVVFVIMVSAWGIVNMIRSSVLGI